MDADALIIATPIYSHQPAGSPKALRDAILGPFADTCGPHRIHQRQKAGDPAARGIVVDPRAIKPRVSRFHSSGRFEKPVPRAVDPRNAIATSIHLPAPLQSGRHVRTSLIPFPFLARCARDVARRTQYAPVLAPKQLMNTHQVCLLWVCSCRSRSHRPRGHDTSFQGWDQCCEPNRASVWRCTISWSRGRRRLPLLPPAQV